MRLTPRLAVLFVLALGACACLLLNLPGHFSDDSVVQLAEGRSGVFNLWHPPILAWLLGIADRVSAQAVIYVFAQVALVFAGLAAFASRRPGGWVPPLLAAAVCLTPQLIIYPAIVWKDVLFAGALVGGFACLLLASDRKSGPPKRLLQLNAVVLIALAGLARQNGLLALPFAALAASLGETAWRRRVGAGVVMAGGALVIVLGATAAFVARSDGEPSSLYQWRDLQAYDLAGALNRHPDLPLQVLHHEAPQLEALMRARGAGLYTPLRIDPLVDDDQMQAALAEDLPAIDHQWRSLLVAHPLLWLQGRVRSFAWLVLPPRPKDCVPVYVGVDGPQPELGQSGLVRRKSPRDMALKDYGLAAAQTPALSHLFYGALGLAALILLLRRRSRPDLVVACLLASAFAFAGSFLVIGVACDYRYLYALDLSVMAALLHVASTRLGWRTRRKLTPS